MCRRRFGVELEYQISGREMVGAVKAAAKATGHGFMNYYPRRDGAIDNSWRLLGDSSADAEVTTPPLNSIPLLRKGIKALMGARKYRQDDIDKDCGLHVHVEATELANNPIACINVLRAFYQGERFLFALQPRHRRRSSWCDSVVDDVRKVNRSDSQRYLREWIEESGPSLFCGNGSRRYFDDFFNILDDVGVRDSLEKGGALNFSPLEKYRTVEVRIGACSLDVEDIVNWTSICQRFIHKCILLSLKGGRLSLEEKKFPKFKGMREFLDFCRVSKRTRDWAYDRRDRR